MKAEDKNKEIFIDMYKSAIRASYFRGIQDPEFLRKSRPMIDQSIKEAEKKVDEKTFRLMKGFHRSGQSFKVYAKKANVFFETSGFCCFTRKKPYLAQILNTRFTIRQRDQIKRFVDFNAVSTEIIQKGQFICIRFEGLPKDQQIKFELQDQSQYKKWTEALSQILHQSLGAQKHFTYLARTCPQFYKYEHILNAQFEAKANTGDILLFRSPHSAARAQRFITNSEFDHVALVLRNEKNELFVYESTSDEGVGMSPWKQMIEYQWYTSCDKICWRPLSIELTNSEIEMVEAFVARTLGKEYEININKLFMLQSKLERNKEEDEKKTYFCSQLVARLYKELKLLDGEKSSASYYPIDFSTKGGLKLARNGVTLGNEQIIVFEVGK